MISKPIAKPKRKSKMDPQNNILSTRSRLQSFFLILILKQKWLERICKVCTRRPLLYWFYNGSWRETVLGLGHQGPMLYLMYKEFLLFLLLLSEIAISVGFYTVAFSWKLGANHFLCFCTYPNYDDFLLQFICQNVPKLILATLGPFGPSVCLSWKSPVLGCFFGDPWFFWAFWVTLCGCIKHSSLRIYT